MCSISILKVLVLHCFCIFLCTHSSDSVFAHLYRLTLIDHAHQLRVTPFRHQKFQAGARYARRNRPLQRIRVLQSFCCTTKWRSFLNPRDHLLKSTRPQVRASIQLEGGADASRGGQNAESWQNQMLLVVRKGGGTCHVFACLFFVQLSGDCGGARSLTQTWKLQKLKEKDIKIPQACSWRTSRMLFVYPGEHLACCSFTLANI